MADGGNDPKWKRQLRRELEVDFRGKQRAKLAELRAQVKAARKVKAERLRSVTKACKRVRVANREHIKKERLEARERINAERDQLRAETGASCGLKRQKVRDKAGVQISAAQGELEAERGRQRSYRVYTRPVKLGAVPGAGRKRAAEKKRESDEEVERNIDKALVPVWRRVKSRIKPTDRSTRTEAFLQWVHDNSAEVQELEAQEAERGVQHWLEQEHEQRRTMDQDLAELADAEILRQYDKHRQEEGHVPF